MQRDLAAWHERPELQQLREQFGAFFFHFGFRRNLGRIWATLYFTPRPLDQGELASLLGLSSGLISSSLTELERTGAVRVIAQPGRRRACYEAERRLLRTVATILTRRDLEAVHALRDTVLAARRSGLGGELRAGEPTWFDARLQRVLDIAELYELLARLVVRAARLPEPALNHLVRALRNTRQLLPGRDASGNNPD